MKQKDRYGKTPLDYLMKFKNKRWMGKYFDPKNGILTAHWAELKKNSSILNSAEGNNNLACQIYKEHEGLLNDQLSLNPNRFKKFYQAILAKEESKTQ